MNRDPASAGRRTPILRSCENSFPARPCSTGQVEALGRSGPSHRSGATFLLTTGQFRPEPISARMQMDAHRDENDQDRRARCAVDSWTPNQVSTIGSPPQTRKNHPAKKMKIAKQTQFFPILAQKQGFSWTRLEHAPGRLTPKNAPNPGLCGGDFGGVK